MPIECITPDGRRRDDIPNHILASDLLGLGCILIKNPGLQVAIDGTASNALVGSIRKIAEYWSNYEISEARAFNILGKLLENIPCFPRELYKLLCVAIRDYFFPNKEHAHRAFEIQARTEKIKEIYRKVIGVSCLGIHWQKYSQGTYPKFIYRFVRNSSKRKLVKYGKVNS